MVNFYQIYLLFSIHYIHFCTKTENGTGGQNKKAKELIRSPTVLAHYNGTQMLVLTCDALPIEIEAVIAHHIKEGAERPIAFALRTLSPTEKKYN